MDDKKKVPVKVAMTMTLEGEVTKLSFQHPDGRDWTKQTRTTYTLSGRDSRYSLAAIKVPSYFFSGVEKKRDITGSWNEAFKLAADKARMDARTHSDYDRLFMLWNAVASVKNSRKPMIEVGVLRGGSATLLAEACLHFGKPGKIYACDTFVGHAEVTESLDGAHKVGTFGDKTTVEETSEHLSQYNFVKVVQGDIRETSMSISERKYSLVHLDVDVYETTRFCLAYFASKVIRGGIMVVDDFGVESCRGVQLAVDEFVQNNSDFNFVYSLTGQALLVRI